MDNEQRISNQWLIIEHVTTWIQSADNKATTVLTVNGILIGFLFTWAFEAANGSQGTPLINHLDLLTLVMLPVASISLLISLACTLICLRGRAGNRGYLRDRIQRPLNTLIFFGKIVGYSQSDYLHAINCTSMEKFSDDLSGQIHVLSQIACEKYIWLNRAYLGLVISATFFLALSVTVFF